MKACLMKVNYDPKYVNPNAQKNTYESQINARLSVTREIYGPTLPERKLLKDTLEEAAKRRLKQQSSFDAKEIARIQAEAEKAHIERYKKGLEENRKLQLDPYGMPSKLLREKENRNSVYKYEKHEKHKEGVAKAHNTIKLEPLSVQNGDKLLDSASPSPRGQCSSTGKLPHGSLSGRSPVKRHQTQSNFTIFDSKRSLISPSKTEPDQNAQNGRESPYQRSKTAIPHTSSDYLSSFHNKLVKSSSMLEMERRARYEAERAIKHKKIFTIMGPYHSLREALRRRGWVEKFSDAHPLSAGLRDVKVKKKATTEETAEGEAEGDENEACNEKVKVQPWKEENGFYNLMSHMVRNCTPAFMFSVKCGDVSSKVVKLGQLVNHFDKTKHIVTKVGLCQNLRNVPWYNEADPNTFYPRCYMMTDEADRQAFIEDYHLTACFSFLRFFVQKYKSKVAEKSPPSPPASKGLMKKVSKPPGDDPATDITVQGMPPSNSPVRRCGGSVTVRALEVAMEQCERFLKARNHEDIDDASDNAVMTSAQWDQFLMWYYQFVHEDGEVVPLSEVMVGEAAALLEAAAEHWPQHTLDGTRNIWILKPSAKSRGRGIQIFDKLGMMLGYVDSNDGKVVLQKYIERPLLVHGTKFDIRQWFLVTDWNPLTLWFYRDSYVRFCSQQYTLDDLHISIHLSNNSVQKYYKNNVQRPKELPDDNMWTSDEFASYLESKGQGDMWEEKIYPGMKDAIICSLLCTQELIEEKKGAFELYGADFMLTEDLSVWLLEINSSPSMARNTKATRKLVDQVLEDTVKVVLDRKADKNCDTGQFELAYKQSPIHEYLSSDPSLNIQGKRILKTGGNGHKKAFVRSGNPRRLPKTAKKEVCRNCSSSPCSCLS